MAPYHFHRRSLPLLLAPWLLAASAAVAQPVDLPIAPATTTDYPPGVTVRDVPGGRVYADKRGLTLYGMDMRTLVRWSPDPAQHCRDECTAEWEPLLAPAGMAVNIAYPAGFGDRNKVPEGFVKPQSAPDWSVIAGPQGPQWVYKGWHMVFTRKGSRPGATDHDGADAMTWNTLKFVPPPPQIVAPPQVSTVLTGGAWALADTNGRVLFTGKCRADCSGWVPLAGGVANRGIGRWTIGRTGDRAQWLYRGKPVFVSQEPDPLAAPAQATILRP